jgi:5-hydroxyisourate hydrolase-like protein (transthyretin family)
MVRTRPFLPLLLFVSALVSFAQEKKLARIEGTVVDSAAGTPLRKVKVNASRRGAERSMTSAETGADGHFVFDNLEPGTYSLRAGKPGYVTQAYGSRTASWSGTALTLTAGQQMKDLEFKLVRQGVIAGKVTDEDGEPAPQNTSVSIQRVKAGRHTQTAGFEQTNDLGEFRVANLPPGRYIVGVIPPFGGDGLVTPPPKTDEPVETLVPTYYPGVTDAASATVLEVHGGQELSGIDIVLRKAKSYRVEGSVAGISAAHPARNLSIHIMPRNRDEGGMYAAASGRVRPDGTFTVQNVVPGSYHLAVFEPSERRMRSLGRVAVDVASSHVRGVVVTLTEPLTVTGTLKTEDNKPLPQATVRVGLRSSGGAGFGGMPTTVNADGTFRIEGVSQDRYLVTLSGFDDTLYLKSVRWGKQDVLDGGLDLGEAQGTVALEAVLGTKPGAVEGTVAVDGKAQAGVGVTLVPDPPRASQSQFVRFSTTDQNGRFSLKGAAPGTYRIYALPETTELDLLFDPDAMKPFEGKGVKVTVEEGHTASVQLAPISSAEAPDQTP